MRFHTILMLRLLILTCLTTIMMSITLLLSAQAHEAGDIIFDEFGIEMVYVPSGIFTLGIDAERLKSICEQTGENNSDRCVEIIREDTGATYLETVELQPFWIDRFEVTIEQFSEFCGVDANTDVDDCPDLSSDTELTISPQQPQVKVSWYAADFICRLRYARLPTEAEWEYAASSPNKYIFAWGDDANLSIIQHPDSQYTKTYPVGSIRENQSWVGAFDLTGNVAEWTDDHFAPRILSNLSPDEWLPATPGNRFETDRVLRGGSWHSPFWHLTNFYRESGGQTGISDLVGFRCARSLV